MPAATATCPTDLLDRMGRQPGGVWYDRIMKLPDFQSSFWFNILPKSPYPMGQGLTPKRFFANRYRGAEFEAWRKVQPSNATGTSEDNAIARLPDGTAATNPCCPPRVQLLDGYNGRTMVPFELMPQSNPICMTDLIHDWDVRGQIDMRVDQYGQQLEKIIINKQRNEWMRNLQRKIYMVRGVGAFGYQEDTTVGDPDATTIEDYIGLNDAYTPTSTLTQHLLDMISSDFRFRNIPGIKTVDGSPVYPMVSDNFTSQNLIRQDDNVREDVRFADTGKGDSARLLQGINVERSFRGFAHIHDIALHFTKVATADATWDSTYNAGTGVWTPVTSGGFWKLVPATYQVATEMGVEDVPLDAWYTAPYTATVVYTDEVLDEMVPSFLNVESRYRGPSLGTYVGKLEFIAFRTDNDPYAMTGRWMSWMIRGYQPKYPRHGALIIHLNCNAPKFLACVGS